MSHPNALKPNHAASRMREPPGSLAAKKRRSQGLVRLLNNGELLNGEIFCSLREAQIVFEQSRRRYNQIRPHSSLGYQATAPEAVVLPPALPSPLVRAAPSAPLPLENQSDSD